jgi:beta-galactosidase
MMIRQAGYGFVFAWGLWAGAGTVAAQAPGAGPRGGPVVTAIPAGNVRNYLLTEQWKFSRSDEAGYREAGFNDAAWRAVDLPHDWSIELPFDQTLASCTAFLPCGIGWYRKTLTVPPEAQGKTITLRFDGVANHSTVYCNGRQVGERPYSYSSFTCDLTGALKFGGENVIAVRVNHEQYADSRWYVGSGIYRNVFLNVMDPMHVEANGTFVTTPQVTAEAADVSVQTTVKNDGTQPAAITLVTRIVAADGQTVASIEQNDTVPAAGQKVINGAGKIARPALWGPGHPTLYTVQTQVKKGAQVVDQYATPFGVRTFKFDPAKGFSLNGEPMKLKGVCLHHDAGALGAAVPIQVWQRRFKTLQEGGVNAIRCSHNPPAPEFLDLCDAMGFLVMDEAFDEWTGGKHKWIVGHNVGTAGTDGYHSDFDKWADIDITDMVVRDRNHPSIIMWSIGNEVDYTNDPFPPNSPALPPVAERLIKDVKAVDTTRPVTAACAFPATNLYKSLLDIEGYNYMERLYAGDHAANPARVIYGSENSHALNTWQAVAQNDYIAGQFLWTGIDYLGEAGTWPAHASSAGMLDLAGLPKNQYYFRKSLWAEAPFVYLSTSGVGGGGRGRGRGATGGTIYGYTNCDTVELFRGEQSLGRQTPLAGTPVTWPASLDGGSVKAVGKKGNATVNFELVKPEAAARLVLLPDVKSLRADGRDWAQIELQVADRNGTLVANAPSQVACTVTGPARIRGIESGDIRTTEPYSATTRTTYQGRLMIYVQSQRAAGNATLTVSAPQLEGATVTLPVQ